MKRIGWHDDEERRRKSIEFLQTFYPQVNLQTLRLIDMLGFVSRSIYHVSEQSVDDAGLSFAQYRVLMHLFFAEQMSERAELNPSEISDRQGVSRNTVSSLIRNLEEEGMVERRLDPDDRRRFNISLTDRGRAVIRQHTRTHLEMMDSCFRALGDEEQATLLELLRKLGERVAVVRAEGQGCPQPAS